MGRWGTFGSLLVCPPLGPLARRLCNSGAIHRAVSDHLESTPVCAHDERYILLVLQLLISLRY
jgi:hypothetical protein